MKKMLPPMQVKKDAAAIKPSHYSCPEGEP